MSLFAGRPRVLTADESQSKKFSSFSGSTSAERFDTSLARYAAPLTRKPTIEATRRLPPSGAPE